MRPHTSGTTGDRAAVGPRALPRLAVDSISKRFGAAAVLSRVSFDLAAGEVLGVCGANGAGKSTLVKILAGVYAADAGTIRIDGEQARIGSPRDADAQGLRFMHQELTLVGHLDAVANMSLSYSGRSRRGFLARRHCRQRAEAVMARVDARIPLDLPVNALSVPDRWMVALGGALMNDARVLVMDEPTASFTDEEAGRVFRVIDELRSAGVAVLYVSHRLDEVLSVCDRVAVLRDGQLTGIFPAAGIDRARLTAEIAGEVVLRPRRKAARTSQAGHPPAVLAVQSLARPPKVAGVSFQVRRGEILGLAGLVGSGRTELARLVAGADRPAGGHMTLAGRIYRPRSSYDAIGAGVAFVPEERRSQALVLTATVAANMAMSAMRSDRIRPRAPFLSARKARVAADAMAARLRIRLASVRQPVSQLSGGNQQKVVLGRCLRAAPKLLILDEPATGVDVSARADLYEAVRALAEAGTAVILISSDFEELEICDRVAVLREGRVVAMVNGDDGSKEHLTALCYSGVPA